MFAYLNERSLEPYCNWERALQLFVRVAVELRAALPNSELRRDDSFFQAPDFGQRFNHLSLPKDMRALVRELAFGARYYSSWRPERMSAETDAYYCVQPEVELRDESAGEACERKLSDDHLEVLLLNASDSAFGGVQPVQIKAKLESGPTVSLRNISDLLDLFRWLSQRHGYYDPVSNTAPRDFQTVLEQDSARFTFTGKLERKFSRRVFLENETGRFFYVDDGHPGGSAHLEVFSATEQHLGTAPIDSGVLDTSTRVNGRRLRW